MFRRQKIPAERHPFIVHTCFDTIQVNYCVKLNNNYEIAVCSKVIGLYGNLTV